MLEVAEDSIQSANLDHHGLVAAQCRELDLMDKINKRLDKGDGRRLVKPGQAVCAMIINGLGFTNRRLYLTPQFFCNKPVDRLLGEELKAEQLDDHTLGKALDEIAKYGVSKFFGEIAFEIGLEQGLLGPSSAHVDTTSFAVEGSYDEPDINTVEIRYGYSKDKRSDLKQVIMSLVTSGSASIPIWMNPVSGNASDCQTLPETINSVRSFQKQFTVPEFTWIFDSAGYSKDKLLGQNQYYWITRVPEKIGQAKALVCQEAAELVWYEVDNGYKISSHESSYGDIDQRWLLVYSEQAFKRESQTFSNKLTKQKEELEKHIWHIQNKLFNCAADAQKAGQELSRRYPLFRLTTSVKETAHYKTVGRPKKGTVADEVKYQLQISFSVDEEKVRIELNSKGRFILATNQLDKEALSDEAILSEYKEQQSVERGFRFLKDPWFMVNSILKSTRRIEALMAVMALCLIVYNLAQFRFRQALDKHNQTIPNQLNKPTKTPTLRWIFQLMEGIVLVTFYDENTKPVKQMMTNLTALRKKIVQLFGHSACEIYGIT